MINVDGGRTSVAASSPPDRPPPAAAFETCCQGPVEFDIAQDPNEVGEHYPRG
jgi:hypothetical protein